MRRVYIRFERGRDDVIGPTFGPFEFLQQTYHELRDHRDDVVAFMSDDGDWRLEGAYRKDLDVSLHYFSDFIVYSE